MVVLILNWSGDKTEFSPLSSGIFYKLWMFQSEFIVTVSIRETLLIAEDEKCDL